MLKHNFENIGAAHLGTKIFQEIRKGTILIWEAVRSCFGAGFWRNIAPWSNKEGWRN